ncbi:MAG: amidohydrolase [Tepidisphaerales bacterium]
MLEILLHNATFWLGPGKSAPRLLLREGRVASIDPPADTCSPTVSWHDLAGAFVTPGLHDAHLHLYWRGEQLVRYADLSDARSWDDVADRLRRHAERIRPQAERPSQQADRPGRRADGGVAHDWVLGRGVNDERLREGAMPPKQVLERALPGRAVVVGRVCGHVGVLSDEALRRLPPEVAASGDADTGLFREQAYWEALGHLPPLSEQELDEAAAAALDEAARAGFTAVGTMLEEVRQLASLERLASAGRLPLRVVAHVPGLAVTAVSTSPGQDSQQASGSELWRSGRVSGWRSACGRLTVGAAKFFSDGTLGARTAWLRDDYSDAPGVRGTCLLNVDEMTRRFLLAASRGYRIAVHAIGDAALDACLTALETVASRFGPRNDRIEHVSLADDGLLDRFACWGGMAVVQPQFAVSDTFLERRLGPQRVRWAYRFRSMAQRGIPLALSSDCPVERLDPDACLAAALTGAAWNREALTEDEAIDAYTRGSARAGGLEGQYGQLVVGGPADLTVFDRPPGRGGRVIGVLRDGRYEPCGLQRAG